MGQGGVDRVDQSDRPVSSIGRRRALARKEQNPSWVARRSEVLAAGAEVFRRKGYLAASMSEIAQHFGAPTATLYYYVESKQEIFHALVVQAVEDNVALAEQAAEMSGSVVERLSSVIRGLARSYDEHYPYLHLYVQEDMRRLSTSASPNDQELSELGARFDQAFGRLIRTGVESGELRGNLDPDMARFAILGALNWTHRWFVPGGRLDGAQIGEAFRDLLLPGLLNHPTGFRTLTE